MDKTILEAIKNSRVIRTGEWVNGDEWGYWSCSSCKTDCSGTINDWFCPECGAFMLNREHRREYHFYCKHCGADVSRAMYIMVPSLEEDNDEPQEMFSECPNCHEKSVFTDKDAEVEIILDDLDSTYLEKILELEEIAYGKA